MHFLIEFTSLALMATPLITRAADLLNEEAARGLTNH